MRSLVGAAPRVARLGTALAVGSLLAACGNSTGPRFTVGFLAVRNDGLPQVLSGGGLAATGPGSAGAYPGGTYYIYPEAPVSLATGVYTLAVPVPAATFDSIFAGTPDRPQITVVEDATVTAVVRYQPSPSAGLDLQIVGLPSGVPGSVERIVGGAVIPYPFSTVDYNVGPGTAEFSARPVLVGDVVYHPSPLQLELSFTAARITHAAVTYAP